MKFEKIKDKIVLNPTYLMLSFVITWALIINIGTKTSNMISILIFACSYYFISIFSEMKNKYYDKIPRVIIFLSAIFALFQTLGNYKNMKNDLNIIAFCNYVFSFLGFFILFCFILLILNNFLKNSVKINRRENLEFKFKMGVFIAIILLWMPFFFIYFPAITPWDTEYQLSQALGHIPLNKAHPIIHTLFFRYLFRIGFSIFNNENLALSLITIVQMFILSGIFTSVISYAYKKGFSKSVLISIFIFYSIMPFISLYAVNLLKDVLFSAVFLLFCLQLWKYDDINNVDKKSQIIYFLKLFITGTIFCMMRNNAIFVFIALIPFLLYYLRKHIIFTLIIIVLIFFTQKISNQFLYDRYDVKRAYSNDLIEMVSIPIQQISRVIKEKGKISSKDYELISKIVDVKDVREKYKPYISDPIKGLIRGFGNKEYLEENKEKYFMLWLRVGKNNFGKYFEAYIDQTKGYWYPDVQEYAIMSKSANKQPDLNFSNPHMFGESFDETMYKLNYSYKNIPVFGNFYSIAFYIWIAIISISFVFSNKKNIIAILPSIILWGTLLVSTPVAHEFRYAYPIIMSIPVIILVMLSSFKKEEVMK